MAKIKKAQRGAGVPKGYVRGEMTGRLIPEKKFKANEAAFAKELQKQKDYRDSVDRASKKPVAKKKLKAGGKIKKGQAGLVASNKRVGPVDPQGVWTKVQEQTLAGKRTPVSLTRDKELGATSMAKGGKWIQKAIKKPGALRAALGAKPGKPIPAGKLAKAAKAKGKLGQRARLAQTLKKMSKK